MEEKIISILEDEFESAITSSEWIKRGAKRIIDIMIPHIQSKVVVKKTTGEQVVHGNCYQTAIAAILDMSPSDVPNVETLFDIPGNYYEDVMKKWLESKGFRIRETIGEHSVFHDGNGKMDVESLNVIALGKLTEDEKEQRRNLLRNEYYLVSGKSPRGVNHICIYQNGKMVHDPHPTGEGILTELWFEVIEKIS